MKNRLFAGLLVLSIAATFLVGVLPGQATTTLNRRLIGAEDLSFATGGTGAVDNLSYITVDGLTLTLTKVDATYLKFRTAQDAAAQSVEALVDGSNTVNAKLKTLTVSGTTVISGATTLPTLSSAGYVKNSAAGLLSTGAIGAADLPTAIDAAKIGAGTVSNTVFGYLAGVTSNIQTQITALTTPKFAILQNRQTQNTSGGTATSGSWLIIPLNTEYEDADNIVTVTSLPAFSLAAGTYRIEGTFPFLGVNAFATRLYNVTDTAVVTNVDSIDMYGSSGVATQASAVQTDSVMSGTFTLAATKQLRVEYQVATTGATVGLGVAANYGPEVFAQVRITKVP